MQNLLKTLMSGFKTLVDGRIHKNVSDWTQNDSNAGNYVKNRTHWEEEKFTLEELVPETTVTIDSDGGYTELPSCPTLTVGETYTVILNGIEYQCVARQYNDDSALLGNGTIYGDDDESNGEPFSIDSYNDSSIYLNVAKAGEYTVRVYNVEVVYTLHKLDPKYIPTDDILIQSSWTEEDNKSKAFILDKPPVIQNEDGEVCIGSPEDIENAERIITEKNFYEPKNHVVIADEVNGYNYIVAMRDGNLVSYVETQSISITRQPTKTSYVDKETFNPNGMVVIATAKDGSTREVTNYEYDIVTTENINRFYIRLKEGTNVFTAKVNNLTLHDFSLEDFNYIVNEDGTYELTAWKGTYNGEPSTRIVIPNSELIIV